MPTNPVGPVSEGMRPILAGHRALVVGIANDRSIAYGCARAFREAGAELAITWLNEKARVHVEPLARELGATLTAPLDVEAPGQLEALFDLLRSRWGKLDSLIHSIAFAPKDDLQGGLLDCSAAGFARAMDVSCHSFIRMARLAAPLMTQGGTMFAMSYLGANRVVANYNVMGPVKAALEASCRYLAHELGPARHPGPRHLPGAPEDAGGLWTEGFRGAVERGGAQGSPGRAGGHHGRGLRLRVPGHTLRPADHRRHGVRRRGRERRRLSERAKLIEYLRPLRAPRMAT